MEEILHHLGCIKPCTYWDKLHINWCRISSINSITLLISPTITFDCLHAVFLPNQPGSSSTSFPLRFQDLKSQRLNGTMNQPPAPASRPSSNVNFLRKKTHPLSLWVFPKMVVPPNHPILKGFSIINHPFLGTPIFGNILIKSSNFMNSPTF